MGWLDAIKDIGRGISDFAHLDFQDGIKEFKDAAQDLSGRGDRDHDGEGGWDAGRDFRKADRLDEKADRDQRIADRDFEHGRFREGFEHLERAAAERAAANHARAEGYRDLSEDC
jgi:hypothetical protein